MMLNIIFKKYINRIRAYKIFVQKWEISADNETIEYWLELIKCFGKSVYQNEQN